MPPAQNDDSDDDSDERPERLTAPATAVDPAFAPTHVSTPGAGPLTFEIGQRLGDRYAIRQFLGQGGMGAVYRALDEELRVEVALKLVRGSAAAREMLRDEVRLAQQVTHRNVCRTYDLERVGDHHFIKMEYVPGETLADRIARQGRLPIDATLRIAREIAAGLAAAHAAGVIHRDLKPGNVMIDPDERAVLMDFGLAQRGRAATGNTDGTPAYMAPEQLAGEGADPNSDYYALGCLVYEMLIGEQVYGVGSGIEIAARQVQRGVPDLTVARPDVPVWLARAIGRMLSRRPLDRPAGVGELVSGPPVDVVPPRRNRIPIVLAGIGVAALAAAAVIWKLRSAEKWQARVVQLLPAVMRENSNAPAISPDGKLLAYIGKVGDEEPRLFTMPAAGGAEPLRHALDRDAVHVQWSGNDALVFNGRADGVYRLRLADGAIEDLGPGNNAAPCGEDLVLVDRNAIVLRARDGSRKVVVPASSGEQIVQPRCDPMGQQIVFFRGRMGGMWTNSDVYVADRAGRTTQLTDDRRSTFPTWVPDGRSIVFSRWQDGRVNLFEMPATGGPARQLTNGDEAEVGAMVSPDGTTLIFNRDTSARVLHVHGPTGVERASSRVEVLGEPVEIAPGRAVAVRQTPDGGRLVVIERDGRSRDLVNGRVPLTSTTGRRVLFHQVDHPQRLQMIPLDGGAVSLIAELPGRIRGGIDAPDAIHVAVEVGDRIEGWRIVDGKSEREADGLVIPAPRGGWRAVVLASSKGIDVRFVAPGAPLDQGRVVVAAREPFHRDARIDVVTWLDGERLAAVEFRAIRVFSVDGTSTVVEHKDMHGDVRILGDGRWLDTDFLGNVTRHVLENFGDRPR